MSEILEKGQLSLEKAIKLFESNNLKEAYYEVLKCLNHLPHKDVFTRALYSSSVVLRREKIEARTNELLGKIYAKNAKRDEFPMKNANNKEQMKKYAIQLFLCVFSRRVVGVHDPYYFFGISREKTFATNHKRE